MNKYRIKFTNGDILTINADTFFCESDTTIFFQTEDQATCAISVNNIHYILLITEDMDIVNN